MGNGESEKRICVRGRGTGEPGFDHSRFPSPDSRRRHQAARRSDSVSDSMLAAFGLTSQNLPT